MFKKIKLCTVGRNGVGKSCIILRIIDKSFKEEGVATIGVDFKSEMKKIGKQECKVELWDTSGQDRYFSVAKSYIRDADGIFIVFDLTEKKSLDQLETWLKQIRDVVDPKVPKMLLANKSDLNDKMSPTMENEVKRICEENKLSFYKVSAKKNTNIPEAYGAMLEESYEYVCKRPKKEGECSAIIDVKKTDKKKCC